MADDARIMGRDRLGLLIEVLERRGYAVIAPTVRAGAVVLDEVHGAEELPWGVGDEQEAGQLPAHDRDDGAVFGRAAAVRRSSPCSSPPRS